MKNKKLTGWRKYFFKETVIKSKSKEKTDHTPVLWFIAIMALLMSISSTSLLIMRLEQDEHRMKVLDYSQDTLSEYMNVQQQEINRLATDVSDLKEGLPNATPFNAKSKSDAVEVK